MTKHHQRPRPDYPRESVQEQAANAKRADLEAQLDTALELLHNKEQRSIDLQQRLAIAIDANQTLRVENAGLKAINGELHEQQVYDQREQMERALRIEAERL